MAPNWSAQRSLTSTSHRWLRLVLLPLLALSACASPVPPALREPAAGDPGVAAVRAAPDHAYRGQAVRWGGGIIETENRAKHTRVTILAQTLNGNGRPNGNQDGGRFIAEVKGFLDPAVFRPGRLLTVAGHVTGSETHPVGKFSYRYPVVQVDTYYLWPPQHYYRWPDEAPYWPDQYWTPYWGPYWDDPWYPFRGPGWPYPYW